MGNQKTTPTHDPEIPREELRTRYKAKPNVKLLYALTQDKMPADERQNIVSTMLSGMEQPFWKMLEKRLQKLEEFYLAELTTLTPVGEGAAQIARAQEGYRLAQTIRKMPAQIVEDLRRDPKERVA